jgi:hypothetical protein
VTVDQNVVRGILQGGDPGYDETAVMLTESALCLVLQRNELTLKYVFLLLLLLAQ